MQLIESENAEYYTLGCRGTSKECFASEVAMALAFPLSEAESQFAMWNRRDEPQTESTPPVLDKAELEAACRTIIRRWKDKPQYWREVGIAEALLREINA